MLAFAIRVLETIFAVGAIGSVFVLVLTSFDDMVELFGNGHGKKGEAAQDTGNAPLRLPDSQLATPNR